MHQDFWITTLLGPGQQTSDVAAGLRALDERLVGTTDAGRVGICPICHQVRTLGGTRLSGLRAHAPLCASGIGTGDRHRERPR